jgi:hypothetical protein
VIGNCVTIIDTKIGCISAHDFIQEKEKRIILYSWLHNGTYHQKMVSLKKTKIPQNLADFGPCFFSPKILFIHQKSIWFQVKI